MSRLELGHMDFLLGVLLGSQEIDGELTFVSYHPLATNQSLEDELSFPCNLLQNSQTLFFFFWLFWSFRRLPRHQGCISCLFCWCRVWEGRSLLQPQAEIFSLLSSRLGVTGCNTNPRPYWRDCWWPGINLPSHMPPQRQRLQAAWDVRWIHVLGLDVILKMNAENRDWWAGTIRLIIMSQRLEHQSLAVTSSAAQIRKKRPLPRRRLQSLYF